MGIVKKDIAATVPVEAAAVTRQASPEDAQAAVPEVIMEPVKKDVSSTVSHEKPLVAPNEVTEGHSQEMSEESVLPDEPLSDEAAKMEDLFNSFDEIKTYAKTFFPRLDAQQAKVDKSKKIEAVSKTQSRPPPQEKNPKPAKENKPKTQKPKKEKRPKKQAKAPTTEPVRKDQHSHRPNHHIPRVVDQQPRAMSASSLSMRGLLVIIRARRVTCNVRVHSRINRGSTLHWLSITASPRKIFSQLRDKGLGIYWKCTRSSSPR